MSDVPQRNGVPQLGSRLPAADGRLPSSGHLLDNMVLFARLLRVGDLDVTPTQLGDWLRALEHVDLRRKEDFKSASRALLVRRREDLDWYDLAFELFWQARDPAELERLEMGLLLQRRVERRRRSVIERLGEPPAEAARREEREPERRAAWSDREVLRRKNFADLTAAEDAEIRKLIAALRFDLDRRPSRRRVRSRRQGEVDLRRALRRSVRSGGEVLELPRRRRKLRRRPLVALCDVSGSMEPYARLLLRFLYALSQSSGRSTGADRLEAFVFGTRLTRITQQLQRRNVDDALRLAHAEIRDWGGGTRTGEALHRFNWDWSRRVLGRGAVVLLISDGWDRGDVGLLAREMDRLHRSCHRLIWLNPLLGSPEYRPLTRGMVAALPHVDDFLPVHDLRSLEQLGEVLGGLEERPTRRGAALRAATGRS
ncbi:MAG TPA: VWA domain-containing protein [Thermoanaerobaculia bacterium]|nr:VWA domain-containing protein [Thermoanaerobaculia bacterium]